MKKVKRKVTHFILRLIDVEVFNREIERKYIESQKANCIIGKSSHLYGTTKIIDLSEKQNIRIGKYSHIRGELFSYPYSKGLSIGNFSYVGENTIIRSADKITIGNNVLIAHNVTIVDTNSHEMNWQERANGFQYLITYGHPKEKGNIQTASITIEDNVWISCNVCILKGVTIGKGAIVAAGSVVTKNVPPFVLVAGNPARAIKQLE